MDMLAQPNSQYDWLLGGALAVAPALLGWEIVTTIDGVETAGLIVETEAYGGASDPASHAYRGPRRANAAMFQRGGYIYTYRSYGLHTCMNIVTGPAGSGQAVLLRALEPTVGRETMAIRRGRNDPRLLASGPGRLTQALGITLAHTGHPLGGDIRLKPPRRLVPPSDILAGPRIGLSVAQDYPWRFKLAGNRFVSRA